MTYYNDKNGRVEIPSPAKTRPRNPLRDDSFDGTATEDATQPTTDLDRLSKASSFREEMKHQRESKSRLRQLLRTDQRSLISGSTSTLMEVAPIITPVRRKCKTQNNGDLRKSIVSVERDYCT